MKKYKNQLSRVIAQEARKKKKQITKSKGSVRRKMLNSNLTKQSYTEKTNTTKN